MLLNQVHRIGTLARLIRYRAQRVPLTPAEPPLPWWMTVGGHHQQHPERNIMALRDDAQALVAEIDGLPAGIDAYIAQKISDATAAQEAEHQAEVAAIKSELDAFKAKYTLAPPPADTAAGASGVDTTSGAAGQDTLADHDDHVDF